MKKLLLSIAIIFLGLSSSFASHLMGGEITYTHVSGNDYEVTLIIYRDCSGINLNTNPTVTFESATCGQNFNFSIPYIGFNNVSQVCGTTTCNGGSLPGVEEYIFRGIVTLTPCSDWVMHWNNGTRNGDITNLDNGNANLYNLYIQTTLNNVQAPNNSSPQYFNPPTPYLCANSLAILSHGATDADGDSLYYTLAQPLDAPGPPGIPIPFTTGHSILQPVLTTSGLSLDGETGKMCFTPSQGQIVVISVLIEEWRNNVLIGTLIREMQVNIDPSCSNNPPTTSGTPTCDGALLIIDPLSSGPSVAQIDDNSITMCPDDSVCFNVNFSDPDNDNIFLTTNLFLALPGASFDTIANGTPNPTARVCWIPNALDSGLNVLTILATDDACPVQVSQSFIFDITIHDQPFAGLDDTICENESIQLQASGGTGNVAFTWRYAVGAALVPVGPEFSCNPCSNPIATPLVTTKYYIEVPQSTALCDNKDTVEITVVPGYTLSSTQSDTNICVGEVIDFSTTPSVPGGYTYTWQSNTTILNSPVNDSLSTGTFNTAGSDTVLVTVVNGNCEMIDTFFVNVSALPDITITTPNTLLNCVSNLQLDVNLGMAPTPNNFSFDWNFGATLNDSTIQNPIAIPTQAITDYIVIVTDTLGDCFDTDTVEVKSCCIDSTITWENSTCFGYDDAKIVVHTSDSLNDLTIEFHLNDIGFTLLQTFIGTNPSDSLVNIGPGDYVVLITSPTGCSYSKPITITEPLPIFLSPITALPDTFICIDGTADLSATFAGATPPIALFWDNNLFGNGPHLVNPIATTTTYTTYAQDANGCISDTQTVNIHLYHPITIIDSSLSNPTICEGESTTFNVSATGGGTSLIYTWLDGNSNVIGATAVDSFVITPSYDGEIFSVVVSDSCTTPTDSTFISTDWANIILPLYVIIGTEGCAVDPVFLPVFENTTDVDLTTMNSVVWDFGDGNTFNFPFATAFPHHFDDAGEFDVVLTITDQYNCVWDTIMDGVQIISHANPKADFTWNPNPTDYLNAELTFNNNSIDNDFNQWLFVTDAQYTDDDFNPVFQFPQDQPGNYDVSLIVTSKAGCVDSITKVVIIDDVFLFYIPTGFTPNGDDINETFKVVGEGLDLSSFKMTIFNKWGELVFESTNPDIGWNGTRGGSLVPDGVYIWKIEAKESHSPIVHHKDGFITITR